MNSSQVDWYRETISPARSHSSTVLSFLSCLSWYQAGVDGPTELRIGPRKAGYGYDDARS